MFRPASAVPISFGFFGILALLCIDRLSVEVIGTLRIGLILGGIFAIFLFTSIRLISRNGLLNSVGIVSLVIIVLLLSPTQRTLGYVLWFIIQFYFFLSFYFWILKEQSRSSFSRVHVGSIAKLVLVIIIIGAVTEYLSYGRRVSFWFFEPAYFSIFIFSWLALMEALGKRLSTISLVIILGLVVFLTRSQFAVVGSLIMLAFRFLYGSTLIKISVGLAVCGALWFVASDALLRDILKVFDGNLLAYVGDRGGSRLERLLHGAYFLTHHFSIFGVGWGNFIYYNTPEFIPEISVVEGQRGFYSPTCNVFIELMIEGGIVGVFLVFVLIASIFTRLSKTMLPYVLIFVLYASFESSYLRPSFWVFVFAFFVSSTLDRRLNRALV